MSSSTAPHPLLDGPRPRMRGWIHAYSLVVAAFAGAILVVTTACLKPASYTVATLVYAVTVCGVFGVSASYHLIPWQTARARVWMKRADHSMIFLFIAGSYTPFCVAGLPSPMSAIVLAVVWAGALAGVVLKMSWPSSPRWLGVMLYILLGWTIIAVGPTLLHHAGVAVIVLLVVGGVFYSVGGVLFAARWPNPWPATFGHHEVFHACTAVAAILHYIAVWLVVFG